MNAALRRRGRGNVMTRNNVLIACALAVLAASCGKIDKPGNAQAEPTVAAATKANDSKTVETGSVLERAMSQKGATRVMGFAEVGSVSPSSGHGIVVQAREIYDGE